MFTDLVLLFIVTEAGRKHEARTVPNIPIGISYDQHIRVVHHNHTLHQTVSTCFVFQSKVLVRPSEPIII